MVLLVRDLRQSRRTSTLAASCRKSSMRTPRPRTPAESSQTTPTPSDSRHDSLRAVSSSRWLVSSGVAPSLSTDTPTLVYNPTSPARTIPLAGTGQRLRAQRLGPDFLAKPGEIGAGGLTPALGPAVPLVRVRCPSEPLLTSNPAPILSPTASAQPHEQGELESRLPRRRAALRRWYSLCRQRRATHSQLRAAVVVGRRFDCARVLRVLNRLRAIKSASAMQALHQVLSFSVGALMGGQRRGSLDQARRGVDLLNKWASTRVSEAFRAWRQVAQRACLSLDQCGASSRPLACLTFPTPHPPPVPQV